MGMLPNIVEVRTTITPIILAKMGQMKSPLASTRRVNVDGLVAQ